MESGLTQLITGIAGVLLPYAGPAAPPGWLLCDGSSRLRSSYSKLFAAIGVTYGSVDGTHFTLPDLRGRIPGGKDDMGGTAANRLQVTLTGNTTSGNAVISGISSTAGLAVGMKAIGAGLGTNATILTVDSATAVTLSVNSTATASAVSIRFGLMDANALGDAAGSHSHSINVGQMPAHSHSLKISANQYNTASASASGLNAAGSDVDTLMTDEGNTEAHPNVQPTIILNYIIKT